MNPDETAQKYVPVVCPTCGTRMHPRLEEVGREVTCPDCGVKTIVRPPERRLKPKPKRRRAYRLAKPWSSEREATAKEATEPKRMLIKCPLCLTRLHPRVEQAGRRARCPDCGTKFVIPEWQPPPERKIDPLPDEAYGVGEAVGRPPMPERYARPRAIEEREPDAVPPTWTFFSGVFEFPWYPEARVRWGYLSIGYFIAGFLFLLVMIVSGLATGSPARAGVILAGFFALAGFWVSVWTFSLACACMKAVIEDTAAGADRVENRPPSDWREWVYSLLAFLYVFTVSATIGYGADLLFSLWFETNGLLTPGLAVLLFPVLLLSAFETGDVILPFSPPVLASLVRYWWAWAAFYVLASLVVVVSVVPIVYVFRPYSFLALFYIAPVGAAATLIYGRLLGRLAWRITCDDDTQQASDA